VTRAALAATTAACVATTLMGCKDLSEEGKACPPTARGLSGFCVPRYVSLKSNKVSGRKGPGADYPALWVYQAAGLPVQVVAETEDWRRVCDPYGGAVWVKRTMVGGQRTVQALGPGPTPVLDGPRAEAHVKGLFEARALAQLDHCQNGWCAIRIGGTKGWVAADRVWGTAAAPQCR
jgi:SH3-like domain-containing protein